MPLVKLDPAAIADGVTPIPSGGWTTDGKAGVSYPEVGSATCFAIEDSSFWFEHRNRVIVAAVKKFPPANEVILDVGGGNGFVTKALEDAGFAAVLLEPAEAGVANAKARGLRYVVRGDLDAARFHEQTIGGIGLFDVIEHIEDDVAFLRNAARLLVPGGRVYVTVPAFRMLWSAADVASGHFRRYRAAAIEGVLKSAGLRVEYSTYFFWILPLPLFLFRVLLPKLGLRRNDVVADAPQAHAARGPRMRAMVGKLFEPELRLVRRAKSVPFGGSCLVVGTRV